MIDRKSDRAGAVAKYTITDCCSLHSIFAFYVSHAEPCSGLHHRAFSMEDAKLRPMKETTMEVQMPEPVPPATPPIPPELPVPGPDEMPPPTKLPPPHEQPPLLN